MVDPTITVIQPALQTELAEPADDETEDATEELCEERHAELLAAIAAVQDQYRTLEVRQAEILAGLQAMGVLIGAENPALVQIQAQLEATREELALLKASLDSTLRNSPPASQSTPPEPETPEPEPEPEEPPASHGKEKSTAEPSAESAKKKRRFRVV